MFAHGFEEGGLGARRGPVDLVGEDDLGEQRPRLEDEGAGGLVVDADAEEVAGQQVGRELNAVEGTRQAAGERLGEERLADAGRVFDEQMALGEQGDEGEVDDLRLAEQNAGDVVAQGGQKCGGRTGGRVRIARREEVEVHAFWNMLRRAGVPDWYVCCITSQPARRIPWSASDHGRPLSRQPSADSAPPGLNPLPARGLHYPARPLRVP